MSAPWFSTVVSDSRRAAGSERQRSLDQTPCGGQSWMVLHPLTLTKRKQAPQAALFFIQSPTEPLLNVNCACSPSGSRRPKGSAPPPSTQPTLRPIILGDLNIETRGPLSVFVRFEFDHRVFASLTAIFDLLEASQLLNLDRKAT